MKKIILLFAVIIAMMCSASAQNSDLQKWANKVNDQKVYSGPNKVETGLSNHKLDQDAICGYLPIKDGKVYYSDVIQSNGTADQLYTSARSWTAKNFVNAQNVIQMDDPTSHKMIIKASCPVSKDGQFFYYTLTIQTKDGRYRYELSDFLMQGFKAGLVPKVFKEPFEIYFKNYDCEKTIHKKELTVIKRNIEISIIESLRAAMLNTRSDTNDDW